MVRALSSKGRDQESFLSAIREHYLGKSLAVA
jgi:hypothetical protein